MGLELLDGTSAAIDVTLGGTSAKCIYTQWSASIGRQLLDRTTFCSTGWKSEVPGLRQVVFSASGFVAKGTAITDPSQFMTTQTATAVVLTADTGCTISGSFHMDNSTVGFQAAANSSGSISGRSTGACTFAWIVA